MTNWKVYWGALFASLFAVSLWRNHRKYQERSRWFRLGKAFLHGRGLGFTADHILPAGIDRVLRALAHSAQLRDHQSTLACRPSSGIAG
jgi:hypothetical protein